MNNLQVFQNNEFGEVRVTEIDGKPYAVGVDVARVLDYANPSKAVIDHCKGISKIGIPSVGGVQETNVIPEGDIYRLIVKAADQSRNPDIKAKAEKFEMWLFDEVLPSIRKHGAYMTAELSPQLQVLINMEMKQKQLETRQEAVEQKLTLVKDTLIHRDDDWRNWVNRLMSRVTEASGGNYQQTRANSYKTLEDRGKCDLSTRARNLRARLDEQGATKTKMDSVNKMDVIESDTRLKEIYTAIVKEMAIVCSVGV